MSSKINKFCFLIQLCFIFSSDGYKQHIERNNIVNKGVWVRNARDPESLPGNFMFRANSIDVDNTGPNEFNAFMDGVVPNSPYITSYVDRSKRAILDSENQAPMFIEKLKTNIIDDTELIQSKILSKLKPASVFNDYPYEIAILLGKDKETLKEGKNYTTYTINEILKGDNLNTTISFPPLDQDLNITRLDAIVEHINDTCKHMHNNVNNTNTPKKSMNSYEAELIKDLENTEAVNKTGDGSKRDVFTIMKDDKREWGQNVAPIPEKANYKYVNKAADQKPIKPVSERGLIKVLSMLTSTFKKIMKQHNDIKEIHKKLHTMNKDFMKNIEIVSDKFQDFDSKYANLLNLNKKIAQMEQKLNEKEEHFKNKEKELSKNLIEFEVQQKKFLTQQRQFYNIQKLMLAQNERVNIKQNAIAKTQSEISRKQNNFARILKKAKHFFVDSKKKQNKTNKPAPQSVEIKPLERKEEKVEKLENVEITTKSYSNSESIKINLFSIPTVTRLENQDHLLLNEKDEKQVDDLVYKYYFNNTFIDSLMKNFLSGLINTGENTDSVRNIKNKREETTETTLMLPVNNTDNDDEFLSGTPLNRERRWISHHSRRKGHRRNKGKSMNENLDDDKPARDTSENHFGRTPAPDADKKVIDEKANKVNPFLEMARQFCFGIGQNKTDQVLSWCIEKSLRRLQAIDMITAAPPPPRKELYFKSPIEASDDFVTKPSADNDATSTTVPEASSTVNPNTMTRVPTEAPKITITPFMFKNTQSAGATGPADHNHIFFPDNDKLESNLMKYDLKPDVEGNVYYEGSIHASEIIKDTKSDNSDIMPDVADSNSKIDNIDPDNLDGRAMRKNLLRRMKYESMLKRITKL